jgi:hypothetical protein
MTRISWDTAKVYSQGLQQGVLYPQNSPGVAWNGLISVTENGDTNSVSSIYVDGQNSVNGIPPGTFAGTLSAYTYPDELEPSLGVVGGYTAQVRKPFSICYRDNNQIHIVYNLVLDPGSDKYETVSDNPSALNFQWGFTTLPVNIPWARPSAHLVILTDQAAAGAISDLENLIYGDNSNAPSLPTPTQIYNLFDPYSTVVITDNGDGTWTANDNGNGAITMLDGSTFQIDWPSAVFLTSTEYRIRSL